MFNGNFFYTTTGEYKSKIIENFEGQTQLSIDDNLNKFVYLTKDNTFVDKSGGVTESINNAAIFQIEQKNEGNDSFLIFKLHYRQESLPENVTHLANFSNNRVQANSLDNSELYKINVNYTPSDGTIRGINYGGGFIFKFIDDADLPELTDNPDIDAPFELRRLYLERQLENGIIKIEDIKQSQLDVLRGRDPELHEWILEYKRQINEEDSNVNEEDSNVNEVRSCNIKSCIDTVRNLTVEELNSLDDIDKQFLVNLLE